QQKPDPIKQLGGRGFFLQAGYLTDVEKDRQSLPHQFVLQIRKVHIDDPLHRLAVRKADVMEKAAAEKGVGKLLFVVRSDDDDRAVSGLDRAARLVDVELHTVEFEQQIVGKLDVGLVDLVDQQHGRIRSLKRLPKLSRHNIVGDVVHAL